MPGSGHGCQRGGTYKATPGSLVVAPASSVDTTAGCGHRQVERLWTRDTVPERDGVSGPGHSALLGVRGTFPRGISGPVGVAVAHPVSGLPPRAPDIGRGASVTRDGASVTARDGASVTAGGCLHAMRSRASRAGTQWVMARPQDRGTAGAAGHRWPCAGRRRSGWHQSGRSAAGRTRLGLAGRARAPCTGLRQRLGGEAGQVERRHGPDSRRWPPPQSWRCPSTRGGRRFSSHRRCACTSGGTCSLSVILRPFAKTFSASKL